MTKLHSVGDLKCLGVYRNNQLATIVSKGHSYFPSILPEEIPVMAGDSVIVNDEFTPDRSEECMIVATRTIKIFPCRGSKFQC